MKSRKDMLSVGEITEGVISVMEEKHDRRKKIWQNDRRRRHCTV